MDTKTASAKRAHIVEAALRCLLRSGVSGTNMTDISVEAGISRMTLYRHFVDRTALFQVILADRFAGMLARLEKKLERCDTLEEALIEGGCYALQLADKDALLREIITKATDHALERFLLNNNEELRAMHLAAWQPTFTRARARGEVREDLGDDRLIEGVRSILNLVNLRSDLDLAGRRAFIQHFLVPSISART